MITSKWSLCCFRYSKPSPMLTVSLGLLKPTAIDGRYFLLTSITIYRRHRERQGTALQYWTYRHSTDGSRGAAVVSCPHVQTTEGRCNTPLLAFLKLAHPQICRNLRTLVMRYAISCFKISQLYHRTA